MNAASVTLVRLPGTHYLTASSSSRTLFKQLLISLIYFILLFDILLAPLDNLFVSRALQV